MPRPDEIDYDPITGSEETQADIRQERLQRDNAELNERFVQIEADVRRLKDQVKDLRCETL